MPDVARLVLDTNVQVSRLLSAKSVVALCAARAIASHQLIVSLQTLDELQSVLLRRKFDGFFTAEDRAAFFNSILNTAVMIANPTPVVACRDPKDDKFLSLAVAGGVSLILTGDQDLLVLHPFRGIAILTPRQYLDRERA